MLTLSTCFYIVKSKFNVEKYKEWIYNFISNVNNFNLVIYTDVNSYKVFDKFTNIINNNPKIKVIFKNMDQFFNYKYKDYWIKNQEIDPYFLIFCLALNVILRVNQRVPHGISTFNRTLYVPGAA